MLSGERLKDWTNSMPSEPATKARASPSPVLKPEIQPQAVVAVVWAYKSHAPDEFDLKRGEMLEVQKIFSDGWAIG